MTVQVLSTVPVMFSYWAKPDDALAMSRFLNDQLCESIKKHPTRFIGLGTVPMQAPDLAIKEMLRCRNELGFPGVQIGSHVNEWNLDAPELEPFWEAVEKSETTVFVHPWDMLQAGDRLKKYWFPWLIGMPTETAIGIGSLIFGGVLGLFFFTNSLKKYLNFLMTFRQTSKFENCLCPWWWLFSIYFGPNVPWFRC